MSITATNAAGELKKPRVQMIDSVHELRSECLRRRKELTAHVHPVPLDGLRSWSMTEDGVLAHRTGRFFRIIGARDLSDPDHPHEQPLIEQSEIGMLCLFVTRIDGEFHGLITYKFEPGTPDGIEVAPTVQATRSNYESAHGGTGVPAAELALSEDACTLADAVQREQESWFLGKVNRNRIILLDAKEAEDIGRTVAQSSWVPIPILLQAALESRLINMDLRSVLSMWPLEATASPGEIAPTGIGPAAGCRPGPGSIVERLPLTSLSQWQMSEGIEHRQRRFFSVVGCRVEGQGREVASWDQPLLAPVGMGQVTLLVRAGVGGPHLWVAERVRIGSVRGPSIEAGFQRGDIADYTTESRRRSMAAESAGLARCRAIHSAVHAEEGGRFRGALVHYRLGLLTDTGTDTDPDPDDRGDGPAGRWIALEELEALEQRGDRLSVELRTCLTMLKGLIVTGTLTP
ncbi:NDP-hexose 2,3-dehydratase [Streptomyces sindenensis]|nr:NDP-hexose 2,3-dehydratase [Streptomyces sindenensis]